MRKNCARKILHAVLDLLPIIFIPVFMIYSHRHNPAESSSYTEQVPIYYESNDISTKEDFVIGNIYSWNDNWINDLSLSTQEYFTLDTDLLNYEFPLSTKRITYGKMLLSGSSQKNAYIYVDYDNNTYDYISISERSFSFIILTKLNGFSNMPQSFVDCISISETQWIKDYTSVVHTFENDIIGAFISNFNCSVNNYFNMSSVFNMNDVYSWINSNLFGGNAPMVIHSIYNIIVYEFIMDLIFLMYSVFMFIIDFATNLLEHFLSWSKSGGSRKL